MITAGGNCIMDNLGPTDMHFLLDGGERRPAHKVVAAAASDVLGRAIEFGLQLGRTDFEYDLSHHSVPAADAFIKIIYGMDVHEALAGRFYVWIEIIQLAHELQFIHLNKITAANIVVDDYKLFIETAKLLGLEEMFKQVKDHQLHRSSGLYRVFASLDIDTVRWCLHAARYLSNYNKLVTAVITTRQDPTEQHQLLRFIGPRLDADSATEIARSLKDPVTAHLVRLLRGYEWPW